LPPPPPQWGHLVSGKILKFLIIQFPLLPCHLAPLRAKYIVQHPNTRTPLALPPCDRPTSTSIKKQEANTEIRTLQPRILIQETRIQKILDGMVAGIL